MSEAADPDARRPAGPLRRGWTTGACATAAARAAFEALITGHFPDPVAITLPRGETPCFALCRHEAGDGWARASVVKDAGDDPDVTHGAEIVATVRPAPAGIGVDFEAGEGVGIVTRPGLPLPPGEPAINPVPRQMMRQAMEEVARAHGAAADAIVEIAVTGGAALAEQTWNPRLGILGGISILGTTGIVVPYSCAAWIHSIHRGVDVARAMGLGHIAGATGRTSEAAVQAAFDLPLEALIDMGDFAGGLLKYVRRHPLPRLTIAGGFAKMTKLAQGALDLHSGRSSVDVAWLARLMAERGAGHAAVQAAARAGSGAEVLALAQAEGLALPQIVVDNAAATARAVLGPAPVAVGTLVVDRGGNVLAMSGDG